MSDEIKCCPKCGEVWSTEAVDRCPRCSELANAAALCHFGILSGRQCRNTPKWVSTFKGQPTKLLWCDEHKPDPAQLLSNNHHGVEPWTPRDDIQEPKGPRRRWA